MSSRTKKFLAIAALVALPLAAWAAQGLSADACCSPSEACCPADACPGPCCGP